MGRCLCVRVLVGVGVLCVFCDVCVYVCVRACACARVCACRIVEAFKSRRSEISMALYMI